MSDDIGPLPGLDELAGVVVPVAQRFVEAGHRLFLVGGVVRDLVVATDRGRPLAGNDIDLTTDARPADIKRLIEPMADVVWTQGERFGTIGARVDGRSLEITTHRAEAYDPDSRKPTVRFGDDIEGDLERRDFTINAAAIELPDGRLHDPHAGIADLRDHVLRTPLSPEISFTDDPLRMLRAARFIPRFGLTPTPELVYAAQAMADRIDIVSVERVADELERLLAVAEPRPGFAFLIETGLLGRVVPALADADRSVTAAAASLASASVAGATDFDRILVRRAGFLWPVRARATDQLERLRYSRAATTATVRLLEAVDVVVADGPRPPVVRAIAARTGPGGLPAVVALAANLAAEGRIEPGRAEELGRVAEELGRTEDLDDLEAPLSGADVMAILDLGPGPEVGEALAHLRRLRLERGPYGVDEARRELRRWWSSGAP